jgi:hypothetical protein
MLTVLLVLAVIAVITSVLHLIGKCPVGVPVLILAAYALLQQLPLGR